MKLLRRLGLGSETAPPSHVRRPDGAASGVTTSAVETYYDEMSDAYLSAFGPIFQGSRPLNTDELLAYLGRSLDLAPGMRLLDAGCGVAGPALFLASHFDVTIEGLTISGRQVEQATDEIARRDLGARVSVRKGDFHQLGEMKPGEQFDRIMFLESLCHAQDYRQVLSGAHNLLKTGGGLYIKDFYVVEPRAAAGTGRAHSGDLQRLNQLYHLELPRLGDLVNLLADLGFLIRFVRMPEYESDYTHWAAFEQLTGRHWAPESGAPGEVIQGVEIFCWKI